MIGLEAICARPECGKTFTKTTHNQKYCENFCTRKATNARIMVEYHRNADIRKGKVRWCTTCIVTKLSRYNPGEVCSSCEKKTKQKVDAQIDSLMDSVVWL